MQQIFRPEHPRPDFARPDWLNLNGVWQFAFDDGDRGLREGYYQPGYKLDRTINVPFCYQCEKSGIGEEAIHPILWYRRAFDVPQNMRGRRLLLRFGAVDYRCQVYVNGRLAGEHTGGYAPFALDITGFAREEGNDLCLRVEDEPDITQPRGKQYWKDGWMGCWYTPVSGVWQTVYLEAAGERYLTRVHVTPDVDNGRAAISLTLDRAPHTDMRAEAEISLEGRLVRKVSVNLTGRQGDVLADMNEMDNMSGFAAWTPEHPSLYDVKVRLYARDEVCDEVNTYFGMRKVEVRGGQVLLNNQPFYQRLVLDQGYWPDTLLTPPSDEALRADVEWTLRLGYNGARKHQKVEDPRYYYWADKLGLLVWGEVPSAYAFTSETVNNLSATLADFIDRDYNHPSIITWVPLNESWGVTRIYHNARMQQTARMLYYQCKALDGTRLVSANDGWEQTKTDIFALHDYADRGEVLSRHFADRAYVENHACDARMSAVSGEAPTGQEAFMVTEYGGIAFEEGDAGTWGYHDKVTDEEAFFKRYASVTDAVREIPYCQGYCYTQLTDVKQETNGILTPDRRPKVDVERFKKLTRNPEGRYR